MKPANEPRRVEIYELSHPTTGEVRYVGKANNAAKRLKSHLRDARRRKTPVYYWINKLVDQGLCPCITVVEVCNEETWPDVERRVIANHPNSKRLLNVAAGGDEPHCSKEQRAENGRNNAKKVHSDPRLRKLWELKKGLGENIKFFKRNGMVDTHNKIAAQMRIFAEQMPHIFGAWASLEDM